MNSKLIMSNLAEELAHKDEKKYVFKNPTFNVSIVI